MELKRIEEKVRSGERINRSDAIKLFRSDDLLSIGHIAEYVTKKKNERRQIPILNNQKVI